jgi:hypothetical protein
MGAPIKGTLFSHDVIIFQKTKLKKKPVENGGNFVCVVCIAVRGKKIG